MSDSEIDFKNTLFLPNTNFPMRAGLPKREPEWIERWDNMQIYQTLRKNSDERKVFTLHDGPPYANGHLHIGHALNKILKDFVIRSKQMLGYDSRYVPGWDCHGLPIEWKIEEKYRKSGQNKDAVPINELRKQCREFADEWVEVQKNEFRRLGVTGDWGAPYKTMDFGSEAVIAEEFMKFVSNGSLYQGSKPVMWSPVEKTALAEAEIEYHEHQSQTIWVKFPIISPNFFGASIVIWTTTPWTIPSNKAVSFNENISYGLYQIDETQDECWLKTDERIILADTLAESSLAAGRVTKHTRLGDVVLDKLKEIEIKHPFHGIEGGNGFWDYKTVFISADFVTEDSGTGFVHMAPSHGAEDYEEFAKRGWTDQLTHNVKEDSSFEENVPFFAHMEIYNNKGKAGKANNAIIEKLIEVGALLARGRLLHSYPHSWRSKAPVIFRNTKQWFVSIDKELIDHHQKYGKTIRERAINSIENHITWTPKTGKNRLLSMIKSRPDWVLSRQRVWGVPITCFIKKHTESTDPDYILKDDVVNKRIIGAFNVEGADAWFATGAKERFLGSDYNSDHYEQVFDILDVWFDSGSTHAFVLRDRSDQIWPANLYLEGTDQHRGWFHSSLLQSCGTNGRAPYKGVLTHGFTLDEKGFKMSKSVGNTVSPDQIINQYGADILRLWVAQADYTADLRIGSEILKGVSDNYRRLRNTMRFMLGSLNQFNESEKVNINELPELELLILHRLAELDLIVRNGYNDYSFQVVFQQLFHFCTIDLSAFYFDIRKDVLYCETKNSLRRRSVRTVLDIIFQRLVTWFAPLLAFTMEEVWLERYPGEKSSVHLIDIPKTPNSWKNEQLQKRWTIIRLAKRVVTGAIEIQRQNKVIGSSLEAAPTIYTTNQDFYDCLTSINFKEICITSSLEIRIGNIPRNSFSLPEVEEFGVTFAKANGNKCNRCWRYEMPKSNQSNQELCDRCAQVIESY